MALATRIRYLSSVLNALKIACKFFPLAATTVRPRIPAENRAAYDSGVAATIALCELLLSTDYSDDGIGEE